MTYVNYVSIVYKQIICPKMLLVKATGDSEYVTNSLRQLYDFIK